MNTTTFGPAFNETVDGKRIRKQHEVIRDMMLEASSRNRWLTLEEIESLAGYPQASVSAQLRHLRKKIFGSYVVSKRRRKNGGTWEYQVTRPVAPPKQMSFLA